MTSREKALLDIDIAQNELLAVGRPELTEEEERYYYLLDDAEDLTVAGADIPPLFMLELFLFSHNTGHAVPGFVLDWLYKGALEFHQADGQEHFERGLGFTAGSGKYAGQGHEFVTARRERRLDREKMYVQIAMLNKFDNYTVEDAAFLVCLIRERETGYSDVVLSCDTLLRGYKAWRGKSAIVNNKKYREKWELHKEEWKEIFKQLETDGAIIPHPKKR